MNTYKLVSLAGLLGAALLLSACEASTPSQVNTAKINLQERMVTETLDARQIDPARLRLVADAIARTGRGDQVTLTVAYLGGDKARARVAQRQGAAYKAALAQQGVPNIVVATVPVADARYADRLVLSYRALTALAPPDCTRLTGYQGADDLEGMEKYRIGCETQAVISRMVADPSDLMGKAGTSDGQSRRSGAIIEPYQAGTPNQPLHGMQASKVGTQ